MIRTVSHVHCDRCNRDLGEAPTEAPSLVLHYGVEVVTFEALCEPCAGRVADLWAQMQLVAAPARERRAKVEKPASVVKLAVAPTDAS